MVFTVESALLDELKKPADDFRVKDLFDARSFNTTRIEIVRGAQTITMEKEKGKDAWKQVTPAPKPADTAKVDALLNALTGARAASFADKATATGLDTPEVSVTITYEEGQKHEKVLFARKGADAVHVVSCVHGANVPHGVFVKWAEQHQLHDDSTTSCLGYEIPEPLKILTVPGAQIELA